MTISSEIRKAGPFDGNGVTTSFPFTFKAFVSSDVKVIFTSTLSVETILVLDSDYTVSLNADQNANPGGSVSYSTLATGERLTILGNIEYTQETDIQNQGGFYPEVIENALDKLTMQVQQVKEIADRAVAVPISSNVMPEEYLATVEAYKISAANSASSASASSALAVSSAINASASETNALNSANAASASEINASNSEISAGASATTATTQAGIATTQAGIATTQAGISTTQAGIATTKASEASLSASNALTSENNAAFSASSAAASYDAFDDRYLGAKSTSPTVDNDGNTLLTGALYFDTTANSMKVWNGSAWLDAYTSTGITDGDKGDITVSGSGATWSIDNDAVSTSKIQNDAVTFAKMQNIATSKLLGRSTAESGDVEEIAVGKGLSLSAGTLVSKNQFRIFKLLTGTTYTPAADVSAFYAFVYGATGGIAANTGGAIGGRGYSEKYYASPSGSYSYSIGAGGTTSGTAGGTTTFDVMSVTGSGGVTTNSGAAGGVGSGGDFNATGGTGGSGSSTATGGSGGSASRAGNGGNGGGSSGSVGGGGGGTGGNNASGATGGIAATTKAAGALVLDSDLIGLTEVFSSGATISTGATGGVGADSVTPDLQAVYGIPAVLMPNNSAYAGSRVGLSGQITIVEVL